jgi:hypothetical protein
MLIGYEYIPSLHDLWLYEDHVVSWTYPGPGSTTLKRPYAWNPGSALYPYRKSIQAMPATYRILGTFSGQYSYGVNLESNPVNKPVFYNSYCPWKAFFFSPTLAVQSEHWQMSSQYRDLSKNFGNQYANGSVFEANTLIRHISHDNVVFDYDMNDMIWPYRRTSPAFGSKFAFGSPNEADIAIVEYPAGISVPALKLADTRTVPYGTKGWMVDSNFKVVELFYKSCYVPPTASPGSYETNSSAIGQVQLFSHDSGSMGFVEISPPTSAEAGDGVLGLIGVSVESAANLVERKTQIALIPPENHAVEPAVLYQQSLGNVFPAAIPFSRQTSQPLANETVALQISNLLTQIG